MKKTSIIYIVIILAVIGGLIWLITRPAKPGILDSLATCVKDSGAKFYGAFWCPHCQNQKAMFGASAKLLPYTECSTPDGSAQNKLCNDLGIKSYPTWIFPDGHKETGELTPEHLAQVTNCPLPAGYKTK